MFLLLSVLMVRVLTPPYPCLFCIIVMCRVLFVITMAWLWNRVLVRCVFLLSTTFRSVYLKGCDVELGRDWLAFVNARFDGSRFLRPLETDLARLCAGHTWNFQAGATQAGSSSRSYPVQHNDHVVDNFFDDYETLRRPDLSALAVAHGLSVDDHSSVEDLREIVSHHVGMGLCSSPLSQAFEGCESLRQQLNVHCEDEGEVLSGRIAFLTAILTNTKRRPLERLLKANGVNFELGSKTGRLRRTLKKHIHSLKKAKSKPSEQAREIHRRQLRSDWPQIPSPQLKRHLVQLFKDETSSAKLATFTCACCAESALHADCGALYDPRILPDYRGSYFELRQNKLKQLNIFDTPENNCKLVPMHETYAKLRPGTLVLAVCDAHIYNIVQNGLPTSTFQLGVQAIKILDPSDEPVEERLIPILSPTSTDMSKDNSAVASFSTFDVAASPAKKAKHAKGGKGKEKMD
ncbi:hypothetical protein F4604DRAFT_1905966 [Suillus subluteus]|nr:hypothetical protein F4604DRAFT_1905966 [Suillus subluteus]